MNVGSLIVGKLKLNVGIGMLGIGIEIASPSDGNLNDGNLIVGKDNDRVGIVIDGIGMLSASPMDGSLNVGSLIVGKDRLSVGMAIEMIGRLIAKQAIMDLLARSIYPSFTFWDRIVAMFAALAGLIGVGAPRFPTCVCDKSHDIN